MDWAMSRPAFKTQLFRFVDVFPALDGREDIARHLAEYFDGVDVPKALDLGVDLADRVPFGASHRGAGRPQEHRPHGGAVHRGVHPAEAVAELHALWRRGQRGHRRPARREDGGGRGSRSLPGPGARAPGGAGAPMPPRGRPTTTSSATTSGPLPRVNVSIKPTALATHYEPLSRVRRARVGQGTGSAPSCGWPASAVPTSTSTWSTTTPRTSPSPCSGTCSPRTSSPTWRAGDRRPGLPPRRPRRPGRPHRAGRAGAPRPITVRLVKGAYWDAETVEARAAGWTPPVFEHKERDRRQLRALHPAAARPPR